jgi:hypothetical protein
MAEGYTLSRSNFDRVRRVVNAYEREPRAYPRARGRQAVFLPGAGSKVYQCVYGTRLRFGTVADPEGTLLEPAVIAVPVGAATSDDLANLRHQDVFQIREELTNLGAINSTDGTIDLNKFDTIKDSANILDIVENQTGERSGLVTLRTRHTGYIGTGFTCIGNDTEVWYGGRETFTAELQEVATHGEGMYLAEITHNQSAIDLVIIEDTYRLYDRIIIRDPEERQCLYIPNESEVQVKFPLPPWQDDDNADDSGADSRHWYRHSTHGLLPVFDLVHTQIPIWGKADAPILEGDDGSVSVWDHDENGALVDTGDDVTGLAMFGDVDASVFLELTPHRSFWSIVQQPCT